MKEVVCRECGKTFVTSSWNASLCSDECKLQRRIKYKREKRKNDRNRLKEDSKVYDGRKKMTEKHISTMAQLTNDAIEAHKRGMTYGKYIALAKGRTGRGV